jgi:hypothetical protein
VGDGGRPISIVSRQMPLSFSLTINDTIYHGQSGKRTVFTSKGTGTPSTNFL